MSLCFAGLVRTRRNAATRFFVPFTVSSQRNMAYTPAAPNRATNDAFEDAIYTKVVRGAAPRPPVFQDKNEERVWLKFRLAQAARIFGHRGYYEGGAGAIAVRDTLWPNCFWCTPIRKHFIVMLPEDLILVDLRGEVQEPGSFGLMNTGAFMIHSAIHAARPDVNCAAHFHSVYGRAFSAFGKHLDPLNQDACSFYDDHVVYRSFGGVVLAEEEGRRIAKTLADKKAAILQNHGLMVATNSIEATLDFYITMERSCQVQLTAEAASGTKLAQIEHDEAVHTEKTIRSMTVAWFAALPEFQVLESQEGRQFKLSDSAKVSPIFI